MYLSGLNPNFLCLESYRSTANKNRNQWKLVNFSVSVNDKLQKCMQYKFELTKIWKINLYLAIYLELVLKLYCLHFISCRG